MKFLVQGLLAMIILFTLAIIVAGTPTTESTTPTDTAPTETTPERIIFEAIGLP